MKERRMRHRDVVGYEADSQPVETVRGELDQDPNNWRRWYRVARAYDYAGDRRRARDAMRKAVELQEKE